MKNMKQKIAALFLAGILVSGMIVPVSAAFSDVPADAWYAQDVADVQKYGIINGMGENRFAPDGLLSYAQAITMAARAYAYTRGETKALEAYVKENSDGMPWYMPYMDYAMETGHFDSELPIAQTHIDTACPRATMADLFYCVVAGQDNVILNDIKSLPDVSGEPEAKGIYDLYRFGILTGGDKYGTFYPTRSITRAETAAILNRVLDPGKRKSIKLEPGNFMHSIDHSAAWTQYQAYEDEGLTLYYRTTMAFMPDGSLYGLDYIPNSGFLMRFRGTYKLNEATIELQGSWDDGTKFHGTYEVVPTPEGDGFRLKMLNGEGMYIGEDDYASFYTDSEINAKQCMDECQSGWGTPPQ